MRKNFANRVTKNLNLKCELKININIIKLCGS